MSLTPASLMEFFNPNRAPQLNISCVSSELYRLLFYARDPIITSDGFGKTGVMEYWGRKN